MRAKVDGLRREFATKFDCVLSEEDVRVIEQLDAAIREIEQQKHEAFNAQLQAEQAKAKIENRLNTVLLPRRDALVASGGGARCRELKVLILQCQREQDAFTRNPIRRVIPSSWNTFSSSFPKTDSRSFPSASSSSLRLR